MRGSDRYRERGIEHNRQVHGQRENKMDRHRKRADEQNGQIQGDILSRTVGRRER